MIDNKTVSLIMPARNEAEALPSLLSSIPAEYDEIIVVSNCSTDDTEAIVTNYAKRDPRIKLLVNNRTKNGIGCGAAFETGIANATGDYIVTADSDGTYPIQDAVSGPTLIRQMHNCDAYFATCSRYPDPDIPPFLRLGVNVLTKEMQLLHHMPITDALSGMNIIDRQILPILPINELDWNYAPEIKLSAWKAVGPHKWTELKIKQQTRAGGQTKQHYIKTGLSHLIFIAKYQYKARD